MANSRGRGNGRKRQGGTFLEFFAGIGLMRLGLERAGWKAVFANDISPEKHAMYAANFGAGQDSFYLGDIHALDPDRMPPADLAAASFPCTDLSLAGMRKGLRGQQSSAYWGFLEVLRRMHARPRLVLLENVFGFLTSNGGRDFEEALLALNSLGYAVDALVIDAANFVPQSRVRLFVVGVLEETGAQPRAAHESAVSHESPLRPRKLAEFILAHPNIAWRLGELPGPPIARQSLPEILEPIAPHDPVWWSKERTDYLVHQMSPQHRKNLMEMRAARTFRYGTVFRRVRNGRCMAELRVDGIAGCLRTPKGGSAKQILIEAGKAQVRARLLTPRECARLMGAGDYKIDVSLNQALFGFGDAVCVPVVQWLAENYLNPLLSEFQTARPAIPCEASR